MEEIVPVDEIPINPANNAIYSIESNNITAYTHGFFKYPCKFIPHVPRWAISKYCKNGVCKVIDPFCGSGTTLVETILLGHEAYGVELDSFGRMLTRVKTQKINRNFEKKVLTFLKDLDRIQTQKEKFLPNINNINLWFSPDRVDTLGKIRFLMNQYKNDKKVYEFLSVCFANIVRKTSNADEQSPKPYISSRFPKKKNVDIVKLLKEIVAKYLEKIKISSIEFKNESLIIGEDARNFKYDEKFDLAVTSPPYINAFDYVRTLRLENLWLNLEDENSLKEVKKNQVGTESFSIKENIIFLKTFPRVLINKIKEIEKIDKKKALVVTRFFEAMSENMNNTYKHLKKGGHYVIVVGDSEIKKVKINTHSILIKIGEKIGYKLDVSFSYVIKNRYLRIPRKGRGGLIKNDWIISLTK